MNRERLASTWSWPDAITDRVRDAFESGVRRVTAKLPFAYAHAARVVVQQSDGTLEVIPDDPARPPMTGIPIRLSIPGSVRVPQGARVLIEYEDGDPRKPYASLFEGTGVEEVKIGSGEKRVARAGDRVSLQMRVVKVASDVRQLFVRTSGLDPWVEVTALVDVATSVEAVILEGDSKVCSD